MLDIFASYHRMRIQEKLMIQTEENGKKPHLVPGLRTLGPNLTPQYFLKN